jgi:hypothetical protein
VGGAPLGPGESAAISSVEPGPSADAQMASTGFEQPAESFTPPIPPKKSRVRRWLVYEIIAVVIIMVVVAGVYVATDGFQFGSKSGTDVLVPIRTLDAIPAGQFDAVTFIISTSSVVNGTFVNTFGITLYTMNPTEFHEFVKNNTLSGGYQWTSGNISHNKIYGLDITLNPGPWDIVFDNPSLINATAIAFYSDLTLTPS